jgi:hypothetical protein
MDTPGSLWVNVGMSPAIGWCWASVKAAVAVVVERPSAKMVGGFSWSAMFAGAPAAWVKVCGVEAGAPGTEAAIDVDPTVVELVNETLHLPLESLLHDGAVGVTASPVAVKETVSPDNACCWASVTVAVAVVVAVPLARIVVGFNRRSTFAAGPVVWVRVWGRAVIEDDVVSVAETVVEPTVVETWNETVQVPVVGSVGPHGSDGVTVVAPLTSTVTSSPPTGVPGVVVLSVAVTVAVICVWPSATTVD